MGTKILDIDPICSDDDVELFASQFSQIVGSHTTVDVTSFGTKSGPLHLEYSCYEVMMMPDIVRMVKKAEQDGYDAAIIGWGRQKWIPEIKENVHKYGFAHKLASFKSLDMGVIDFQKDHDMTMSRIRQAAREAIERDGADVIVLGCTAEIGFYQQLQDELGVPVIDVSLASVKYAEFLVNIKQKMKWSHSKKVGYQSPPDLEVKAFHLFT